MILLQFSYLFLVAQEYQWALGFGDHIDDSVVGTATDTQGNLYITGKASGGSTIGDFTTGSGGTYIAKLSSDGVVIWVRLFEASHGTDIVIDDQQNVYLCGIYSYSFTFEGVTLPGGLQSRIYLMKLDPDGDLIWLKDYGTISDTGRSYVNGIALDPFGAIYLGGNFQNPIELGDSTYNVRGRESFDSDMLLVKLSPEGEVLQVKNPGSRSDEYIYDIAINSDGVYAVGYFLNTSIEFDSTSFESPKRELGFIFKYSLDGRFEWANTFNAPIYSEAFSVTLNTRGEAIVSGYWFANNNGEREYIFISKIGKDGEILNNQLVQGTEYIGSYISGVFGRKRWDIVSSGEDVFLTAGLHGSTEIEDLSYSPSGYRDVLILKFNEIGFPQWLSQGGGTGIESGISITSFNNSIYVAGEYASNPILFGDIAIGNNSGNNDNDAFILKISDSSPKRCPEADSFSVNYSSNFCDGDSILLKIENPYTTYTNWLHDNIDMELDNRKQIYISEPGVYEVQINSDTRCPVAPINIKVDHEADIDEETDIIIYSNPIIEFDSPEEICFGDSLSIFTPFDESYNYAWSVPESLNAQDTTLNYLEILVSSDKNELKFFLDVTNSLTGCTTKDSLVVIVNPTYNQNTSASICEGDSLEFGSQKITSEGIFTEVFQSQNGCDSTVILTIDINPIPTLDLQSSGAELTVYSNNANSFFWFLEGIELVEFKNQETVNFTEIGNYYVTGINTFGCMNTSDTVFIDQVLSIENSAFHIEVFPNPTIGNLNIKSNAQIHKIEILNLSGQIILTSSVEEINIEHFDKGIYLLNIHSNDMIKTVRIIKN
ncbi:MAG: T9SS type A sorting domain-containing protein [Cyclobacteriaceae bacterium]